MPQKNQAIEGLLGASGNPFTQMGSAFLASRYDPSVNPWTTSMENLAFAKKAADLEQDRQRQQQLRERLAQFFGPGGQPPPMGAMSPAPPMGSPMGAMAGPSMSMANQINPPMTQQQRFAGLPQNQQQYLRNMALRGLFEGD